MASVVKEDVLRFEIPITKVISEIACKGWK